MVKPLRSSAIRDLLALTEQPHVISLAGGLPCPDAFPVDALAAAFADVVAEDPTSALQYGPSEGDRHLRSWVAERHAVDLDHVRITSGSQQALDLLARTLVDPGDEVALAEPAYVGAIQAFAAAGARLLAVPADEHGMRVDALAALLAAGHRPRLVYVVANFDNPTGATLPADRRAALAALADEHDLVVVDDDPYGALRWRGTAPAALRTMGERVVTLGSTSKVLAPGLRVGWAVGHPDLLRRTTLVKQAADLHTSSLSQRVVHRVLATPGFLDAHVAQLRERYRAQADALVGALRAELGDRLTMAEPDGGMFLWGRLTDGTGAPVDTDALLPVAIEAGTAFVPGSAFALADGAALAGTLRLSFATAAPADLAEAARRLALAVERGIAADTAAAGAVGASGASGA